MKKSNIGFTLFFVLVAAGYLICEPGFNGSAPGCSGTGCHTFQSGSVTTTLLPNNQVQVTVIGNSGNIGGELVNSGGTVVASINSTSSNPFILTAPAGGSYTVNAGYKNPARRYGTAVIDIVTPPAAPGNLTANVNQSPLSVTLQWTDNSSDEEGFIIEKEIASDTYIVIDTVNAGITSYQDPDVIIMTYRYRVKAYNAAGSSAYSNIAEVFVPVELVSFSAVNQTGKVILTWRTITELNNKGFAAERLFAGTDEWMTAGYINGMGTSMEITDYSFTDVPSVSGDYFYRLRQINLDGTVMYSNEIEVTFTATKEFYLEQNYPNPFNPATTIKYSIPAGTITRVSLSIYDILGNEIAVLVNEEKPAGEYQVEWSASAYSSGVYFYSLQVGEFTSTKKLLLIK